MTIRKLFLEVTDPSSVANAVEQSLFVPTRLPWQLGDQLVLGLRLPHTKRLMELPVLVIGRRPPRSSSLLSAGVFVRLSDPGHPLIELLHELAAGRFVDLEARLQERQRLPVRVKFGSRDEAAAELLGLLGEDGAIFAVNAPFVRGDRLALNVVVGADVILVVHTIVRRMQTQDGKGYIVVNALDAPARKQLGEFLNDESDERFSAVREFARRA